MKILDVSSKGHSDDWIKKLVFEREDLSCLLCKVKNSTLHPPSPCESIGGLDTKTPSVDEAVWQISALT